VRRPRQVPVKEKELRVALVCSGGISLAVYMHGISVEFLKLVRASGALHTVRDRTERARASFGGVPDRNPDGFDSESIYFELLREIGRTVDLRVIVDVIAGASAGGINATMLARALSHDLSMSGLRDLWLEHADVADLLAPEARAGDMSKWFMRPLVWLGRISGVGDFANREVRSKISLFLRSRWFKPPLDGGKLAGFFYDALISMGQPRRPGASLLPPHHQLDLFVTATDYHGYQQLVQIHDPPMICESEHRHVLRFTYRHSPAGAENSDFDLANAAALAFAARATSSFPGAFPPAQIAEIDDLLAARRAPWPRRAHFIERNFEPYRQVRLDPATVSFIDGSVLNNRPFREALSAIHDRPAYREVDRRLVYIDPDPATPGRPRHHDVPGFFATLRGALSNIPRAQPIADELRWVLEFNAQARRLKEIVETARPQVDERVTRIIGTPSRLALSEGQIGEWRELATVEAEREAGFAYDGYVRLKLASSRAFVSRLIMNLRGVRADSPFARAIAEVVEAWAARSGSIYEPPALHATGTTRAAAAAGASARWVKLLLAFDVDYRRRRLHFLIRGQNRLYLAAQPPAPAIDAPTIDRLKSAFYACLDELARRERNPIVNASTRALVAELFPVGPSLDEAKDIVAYARALDARHSKSVDRLVDQLAADVDLDATTRDIDGLLEQNIGVGWPADAAREVLVDYLGFPFFDVLTFPLLRWREVGEFDEVLIDRISARDAAVLRGVGAAQRIRGVDLEHFAAFLSRSYRENDYLIGRLHAFERLVDIVCNAAGAEAVRGLDLVALKLRGFTRILEAEEPHLPNSTAVVAELRSAFEKVSFSARSTAACASR
jgi:patatin-related protein